MAQVTPHRTPQQWHAGAPQAAAERPSQLSALMAVEGSSSAPLPGHRSHARSPALPAGHAAFHGQAPLSGEALRRLSESLSESQMLITDIAATPPDASGDASWHHVGMQLAGVYSPPPLVRAFFIGCGFRLSHAATAHADDLPLLGSSSFRLLFSSVSFQLGQCCWAPASVATQLSCDYDRGGFAGASRGGCGWRLFFIVQCFIVSGMFRGRSESPAWRLGW